MILAPVMKELTWSIAQSFTVLNDLMENKNLIFYKYFDLFSEIMVTYTMFRDHDIRKKQNISKDPASIFHITKHGASSYIFHKQTICSTKFI